MIILHCRIFAVQGVESERCPSFSEALKHGEPVMVKNSNSIADGLAVAKVGTNSFNIVAPLIDKMVKSFNILHYTMRPSDSDTINAKISLC